ncbi:hypothetical protein G9A89_015378 [Geosiphon pyriformis]|nr:hypothetical protein G9A89_015378 [Geosiphon pyriformis]
MSIYNGNSPSNGNTPQNFTPDLSGGNYSSLTRNAQYYFSCAEVEQHLNDSRGRGDVAINKEHAIRSQYIDFIEAAGKKLGLPQLTINTAQVLYQRFFIFHSMKDYPTQSGDQKVPDQKDVCATCIFVASKIDETYKKHKEIVIAVNTLSQGRSPENNGDGQWFEDQRRKIVSLERLVLETMCFNFQIKHPFKHLVLFTKKLKGDHDLAEKAWKIARDSYKTTACLRFPAHTIAAASIYLAANILGQKDFPSTNSKGVPWYKICMSRIEDVEEICHLILDHYIQGAKKPNDPVKQQYTTIKIALNRLAAERTVKGAAEQRDLTPFQSGQGARVSIHGIEKYHTVRYRFPEAGPLNF